MEREDILTIKLKSEWNYARNLAKNVINDLDKFKQFLEWFASQENPTDMKELPRLEKERLIEILKNFMEIYRLVG